jgi:hypothetical protein
MSGLAIFRPSPQYEDLSKLAEEHFNKDLGPEDRQTLITASKRVSRHALIGSAVGMGLGLYAAVRLRRVRMEMFNALRGAERPVKVVFADGRTGESSFFLSFLRDNPPIPSTTGHCRLWSVSNWKGCFC